MILEEFMSQDLEVGGKDLGYFTHLSMGYLSRFLLAIEPTFWMGIMKRVSRD